ncbi:GATA zinc finger domain-containing protein 14-like isoform X2 [Malaya genurostris]|uniref:GATA zinc finger domain-containing protein 14-like isoform X2 n=1 Tax=Malaya genurostris TaxID=325434 RepID=UPI0026F3BA55|nr:GATA zinc finger domain-containing protein 14-like isoform X2 [Malaya genurostris]
MRVKTVRQIKNHQRLNRKIQNEHEATVVENETVGVTDSSFLFSQPLAKFINCMNPPYRMPPQPLGTSCSVQNDHPIPGTAATGTVSSLSSSPSSSAAVCATIGSSQHLPSPPLRTHSSKFPIERELVLSSNKNASKIPLMHDNRKTSIPLLNRSSGSAVGPELPTKQTQAWNQAQIEVIHSSITGTIPRNAVRLPEDVTALAERDSTVKDRETVKNSVSKNYHKLKGLISSKFKKEIAECANDELNNMSSILQQQQQPDSLGSSFLVSGNNPGNNLNHTQSNINLWSTNVRGNSPLYYHKKFADPADGYNGDSLNGFRNMKAMSQPQLNTVSGSQSFPNFSPNPMDGTDSDDGGFRQHNPTRTDTSNPVQQNNRQTQQNYVHIYRHNHPQGSGHQSTQMTQSNYQQTPQARHKLLAEYSDNHVAHSHASHTTINIGESSYSGHEHVDKSQKSNGMPTLGQKPPVGNPGSHVSDNNNVNNNTIVQIASDASHVIQKQIDSISSSDYDRNGNHSSNVDSGRGSAAYSSGRKGGVQQSINMNLVEQVDRNRSKSESEWIDVVDAELRNILEPEMKGMMNRPESTVSESASSMSPPLPPLSPDGGVSYNAGVSNHSKLSNRNQPKLEYGTDTYNRASKNPQPIGPSKGHPSNNTIQNYMHNLKLSSGSKKQEQTLLKKHLFGLDSDRASVTNTTRSLDLESLLGGPWEAGQSVSESETDGGGLQQIRNQLEGLETMYSEVLKMLGNRMAGYDVQQRANRRRRHGSLSSLPSSSVSGRPIRDRRRTDERRKVRDIRGINKRFQRLESHVVTLARSVAHLSSEMRSQHVVSQELEEIRNDMAMLRTQSMHHIPLNASSVATANVTAKEPMNLTNPRRVKKLTKFFGEDPPLMKLFLKKLGYEKYASIFESERVGMIELPYLGEERLQKMGIPLGPRLRILQEAQISLCRDTTLCIV